jgi:Na+/H+ antiporter NhaD/arsenite permease-like protein
MISAALGSYFTTRKTIHRANHFNFHPIREVAILFIGIFATMMPALDWLQLHAGKLGHPSAGFFYFSSGTLSSLLDNAPTYLSFLSVILGSSADPAVVKQVHHLIQNGGLDLAQAAEPVRQTYEALRIYYAAHFSAKTIGLDQIEMAYVLANAKLTKYLVAISIAAVFFGASTYIGNAPNFMVKFIADQQRVHTPGFIGYLVRFTLPFMVPMLVLVWCLFFRQ